LSGIDIKSCDTLSSALLIVERANVASFYTRYS